MRNFIQKLKFKGKNRIIRLLFKDRKEIIPYSNSRIFADTGELIGWDLYWNGGYEKEVAWILDKIIDKNSVCLDIGANVGVYTILLAEKCKKVISFEPHPDFYKKLEFNVVLNNFTNVWTHRIALSSDSGNGILFSPPEKMKNKSASMKPLNAELNETIEVKKDTLDHFLTKEKKIDFIKIDTDGSDPDIIIGGQEIIKKFKPKILFEYIKEYPEIKKRYEEAISFLTGLGYEIFEVLDGHLKEFQWRSENFANLIAIPKNTLQTKREEKNNRSRPNPMS